MSKEYIERGALIDFANNRVDCTIDSNDIARFPTADVVEVKHGRWKYYHKQNIAVCTNCSFERKLDDDFGKAVSCPNCGAKMDGET
jgi:hypothetical protein